MMGLQATAGKRKLEAAAAAPGEPSPAKNGRWEADDCIARLQAVAVPGDAWRSPTPSLAATLLSSDDFDDDDEFEDELSSDDDRCAGAPEPAAARFVPQPYAPSAAAAAAAAAGARYQPPDYWQYYQPPQQQTIRCEENGKSYLELGAAPAARPRCCDGRTRWCHVPCYRQRRLAVLNLSMCKLARYRQCSDPSLRRSVLICNTLRRLEREMEAEPPEPAAYAQHHQPPAPAAPEPGYEQSLREAACPSGRATPFPAAAAPDTDSGLGDDDLARPINWGSVLSLTAQTDLEPLNNNELYAELGLSGEPPEWKDLGPAPALAPSSAHSLGPAPCAGPAPRNDGDWEGFMHVLVGGT